MKLRICVFTMLLPALATFGQNQIPAAKEYRGTQLIPTGVAFHHAVAMYRYQVETDDSSNELVEEIQYRFKVDFNTADDLLVLFLEAAIAIEADSHVANSALACMDGDPYEILAQMYDVNEDVGLIHYERLKKRLDKVNAWKLDDWISDLKEGMVYVRIDFEAAYRQSGKDASAGLAQMCRGASVGAFE